MDDRTFCQNCGGEVTYISDWWSGPRPIAYDGYIRPKIVQARRHKAHRCPDKASKFEKAMRLFTGKKKILIERLLEEGKYLHSIGVNLDGFFGRRKLKEIIIQGPSSVTVKELERWVKNIKKVRTAYDSGWLQK